MDTLVIGVALSMFIVGLVYYCFSSQEKRPNSCIDKYLQFSEENSYELNGRSFVNTMSYNYKRDTVYFYLKDSYETSNIELSRFELFQIYQLMNQLVFKSHPFVICLNNDFDGLLGTFTRNYPTDNDDNCEDYKDCDDDCGEDCDDDDYEEDDCGVDYCGDDDCGDDDYEEDYCDDNIDLFYYTCLNV